LIEGLVQGAVGTLVGMALGYLMGVGLLSSLQGLMDLFLRMKLSAPVISPALVVTTVALGVGVTLLAGLLPAFSAGRVTPLEALRPSVPESAKRAFGVGTIIGIVLIVIAVAGLISGNLKLIALGGLIFFVGLVLVAPALVKPIASVFGGLIAVALARQGTGMLAQGNLTRQPSRSAITASATMIGLAIIVAMGGVLSSITGTFLTILQKSLGSDYLLIPPSVAIWGSNVGLKSGLADRFRAIEGVGAVSTLRYALAIASPPNGDSTQLSLLGIDPAVFPQVAGLNFQEGNQSAFAELATGRSVIANGIFAAQAGLHVGDVLRLASPEGEQEYRVAAIAGDYLNAKVLTAYISQDNLREDWRKTEDIFIQINLAPGADAAVVESRLKSILEDYPQFRLISGKAYFDENRQLFNVAMGFYVVLLLVLTLPSLVAILNTLAIGVIERTREIGMLRAIGSTRWQVRLMVLAEALLLAAIGTAFGLLAGLYLGYVMVLGLSVGGFPVTYAFPLVGVVAAIAVGLLFGALAALIPARQAAHLEIIRALRYE